MRAASLHPALQKYQPLSKYCTNIQAAGVQTDSAEIGPSPTVFSKTGATLEQGRLRTSSFEYILLNYLIRKKIMENGDLKQLCNQANFMLVLSEDVATRHCVHCVHFQNDETRGQNKWNRKPRLSVSCSFYSLGNQAQNKTLELLPAPKVGKEVPLSAIIRLLFSITSSSQVC